MEDATSPATQADLILVKSDLKADIAAIKSDVTDLRSDIAQMGMRMETGFRLACEDTDRVLNVVVHIDQSFQTQLKDHERRLRKLEKKYGIAVAA